MKSLAFPPLTAYIIYYIPTPLDPLSSFLLSSFNHLKEHRCLSGMKIHLYSCRPRSLPCLGFRSLLPLEAHRLDVELSW